LSIDPAQKKREKTTGQLKDGSLKRIFLLRGINLTDFRRKLHEPGGSLAREAYISELSFSTANR
jgi:hypothetical protein